MSEPFDQVAERARGEITEDLFRRAGPSTPDDRMPLRKASVAARLHESEQLHFLLANADEGLTVEKLARPSVARDMTVTSGKTFEPGRNYLALAAITSHRVLFLIGRAGGDKVYTVALDDITTAQTATDDDQLLLLRDENLRYGFRAGTMGGDAGPAARFLRRIVEGELVPPVLPEVESPQGEEGVDQRADESKGGDGTPTADSESEGGAAAKANLEGAPTDTGSDGPFGQFHDTLRQLTMDSSASTDAVLGEWYETLNTFYREGRPDWEQSYRDVAAEADEKAVPEEFDTRPLDPHAAFVLSALLPGAEQARRPVAPESSTPLPLFVETDGQLERAEALLSEFPAPETASTGDDGTPSDATAERSAGTTGDDATGEPADSASGGTEPGQATELNWTDFSEVSGRTTDGDGRTEATTSTTTAGDDSSAAKTNVTDVATSGGSIGAGKSPGTNGGSGSPPIEGEDGYLTRADINLRERYDGPLYAKLIESADGADPSVAGLRFEDTAGERFWLRVQSHNDQEIGWTTGTWYGLQNVFGPDSHLGERGSGSLRSASRFSAMPAGSGTRPEPHEDRSTSDDEGEVADSGDEPATGGDEPVSTTASSADGSSGPAWSSTLSGTSSDGTGANRERSNTASAADEGAGGPTNGAPESAGTLGAGLSDVERERVADIVALQPTKNAELGKRWNISSGSEVYAYLRDHLDDYYYRDDDSLIRATDEAMALIGDENDGRDDDGSAGASAAASDVSNTESPDSVRDSADKRDGDDHAPTDDGTPAPSEADAGSGGDDDKEDDVLDSIEDEFDFDL